MRAVIDANVVASHAISARGPSARIRIAWSASAFVWLVSEAIFQEYDRTLRYDRVRRYSRMSHGEITRSLRELRAGCEIVASDKPFHRVTRDPKDDMYLACAINGRAEYVVSGDRHLLELERYESIPIITPAAFVQLLEVPSSDRQPER